jgi:hypothetical protein
VSQRDLRTARTGQHLGSVQRVLRWGTPSRARLSSLSTSPMLSAVVAGQPFQPQTMGIWPRNIFDVAVPPISMGPTVRPVNMHRTQRSHLTELACRMHDRRYGTAYTRK